MSTTVNPYAAPSMEVPRPVVKQGRPTPQGMCAAYLAIMYFGVSTLPFDLLAGFTTGAEFLSSFLDPAGPMVKTGRGLLVMAQISLIMALFLGVFGKTIWLALVWYIYWMTLYVIWLNAALKMGTVPGHPWLALRIGALVACSLVVLVTVHRLSEIDYLINQSEDTTTTDSESPGGTDALPEPVGAAGRAAASDVVSHDAGE